MRKSTLLAVTCGLLASATLSNANVIQNGGFENPILPTGGWATYGSITGWTTPANGQPIEIGWASNYGITGQEGNQVLELDSYGNATVYKSAYPIPAGSYTLSFLYAARGNRPLNDSTFDVFWDNNLLGSIAPSSTAMAWANFVVTATTGDETLAFVGTGPSNNYGALIDDVRLQAVPDGGSTVAFLGLGLGALSFLRRKL